MQTSRAVSTCGRFRHASCRLAATCVHDAHGKPSANCVTQTTNLCIRRGLYAKRLRWSRLGLQTTRASKCGQDQASLDRIVDVGKSSQGIHPLAATHRYPISKTARPLPAVLCENSRQISRSLPGELRLVTVKLRVSAREVCACSSYQQLEAWLLPLHRVELPVHACVRLQLPAVCSCIPHSQVVMYARVYSREPHHTDTLFWVIACDDATWQVKLYMASGTGDNQGHVSYLACSARLCSGTHLSGCGVLSGW